MSDEIVLNEGQKACIKQVHGFLGSSAETFMVIDGAGGTGKTTVAKHIVKTLHEYHKTRALLGFKGKTELKVAFTATTNKACEALRFALGGPGEVVQDVPTIHSFLRLIMAENPVTMKDELTDSDPNLRLGKMLVFIDEASYIDEELMAYIEAKVTPGETKVIFMGDPAQLKSAGSKRMPVFDNGTYRRAVLTKVERFDESTPIHDLAVKLRELILAGDFRIPKCPIDGKHIIWLPRPQFDRLMLSDMSSNDWSYSTSKFLAYRNKRVQQYNKGLYEHIQGSRNFRAGDYAVNNHFVSGTKASGGIGTDRMVFIDAIEPTVELDVPGHWVYLDGQDKRKFFLPDDHNAIVRMQRRYFRLMERAENEHDEHVAREHFKKIKNTWIDLRPIYSQTVYKAQGSTFRRVFIDLADLGYCPDPEQRMRMLYVACSRARKQLFLTGDFY